MDSLGLEEDGEEEEEVENEEENKVENEKEKKEKQGENNKIHLEKGEKTIAPTSYNRKSSNENITYLEGSQTLGMEDEADFGLGVGGVGTGPAIGWGTKSEKSTQGPSMCEMCGACLVRVSL